MDTNKPWSLQATSTDLKRILASFRIYDPEDQTRSSFAKSVLSAIRCNEIEDTIHLLSSKDVVLQSDLSNQAGHATSKKVYVFKVEVFCTEGTLKVREKDAAKRDAFFHSTSRNLVKVIWVYSKSVSVVDAKLTVFMNYEFYLKKDEIYIHHNLENNDNVIKILAYQEVSSLVGNIESIADSFSTICFDTIFENAIQTILSRNLIRQLCNDIFLRDKDVDVGKGGDASYTCRLTFTVRRLRDKLVKGTLHETAKALGSEVSVGILEHIESNIQTNLKQTFLDLKFKIPVNLLEGIKTIVEYVLIAFLYHPLLGIIIAIGYIAIGVICSVDVNSIHWRGEVSDDIYETIVKNRTYILSQIGDQVKHMCWQAQVDLYKVSDAVNEYKRGLRQIDLNTLVLEWKEREKFKNIFQKHPSILTYLVGTRDGFPIVKVFLTGDDKKDDELQFRKRYPAVNFEFVDVDTVYADVLKNMEKIEKLEQSAPEIDKQTREKMNKVIKRHAEILFANHSGVIGIDISNVRSCNNIMINEFCIVFLCLDESILPYGEQALPKDLEGYPCDIREDFVMFGHCVGCQTLSIGCSIGIPLVKLAGSVGFFVRSNESSQGISKCGFLTAAHVAIQHCDELYEQKSLLSRGHLANNSNEIVHPSYADNTANVVIGKVIESFFGNYGTNGTGIDAAFVQTNQRNLGEEIHLPNENSLLFNGSMLVKKRGRTTGDTIGKLVGDCMYVRVYCTEIRGRYYEFENCFAVKQRDETKFFEKGDSGSGVFLIDEKDSSLKPLGIAFAFFRSKTAVCKIRQITNAFNVSVYEYEELMDTS